MRWGLALLVVVVCGCGSSGGHGSGDGSVPNETWTWLPVAGMQCADGSPTGIGVNLTTRSDRVFVFVQGGGACWDLNTCFVLNAAVHITGGYGESDFRADLATLGSSYLVQREAMNPFRDASWIYVPYCTGDLHDGSNVMTYDAQHVVHHVGRTNAQAAFAAAQTQRPSADTVWLLGVSAGGYGVAFDWDLARAAWPQATVHALSDSSPLVAMESTRYAAEQAAWHMTFPAGCASCSSDLGAMPAALRASAPAGSRYGLLANLRDQTISTYFGIAQTQLSTATLGEQAGMVPPAEAAFVVDGTSHVLLANPATTTSGGLAVSTWVNQWATGDSAWANAGP